MTGRERIEALLSGHEPDRIIYSPNIWQWFNHHKTHDTLPKVLQGCETLLDAHLRMGEDCFSRNLATNHTDAWYGGFTTVRFEGVKVETVRDGFLKKVIYHTRAGVLTEEFVFEYSSTTLVQTKFLLDEPHRQLAAFKELVTSKHLDFNKQKWDHFEAQIGSIGMNIFGDWCNPLKLFHFAANPTNTVYLLMDYPNETQEIMEIHTQRCLESVQQAIAGGIKVMMTMDNLDSMFYPPPYFEKYCAPFFRKVADMCHSHNIKIMSHACGQIRELLLPCIETGLDGLEGMIPRCLKSFTFFFTNEFLTILIFP